MSNWQLPTELPDLRRVGILALDTETKDNRLRADMGSGWPFHDGHLCGVSVAYRAESDVRGFYFPIRHPDTENFDPEQVYQWLRDHLAADVRFVTQNGLYDFGWLRAEADIRMPPGNCLEETSALATMVDENRYRYGLDALCSWRGLPGKDETLLRQGIDALGLITTKRTKVVPQDHLWQLPARYVRPYAEADAVNTFLLREDLDPILDREGTRAAYRLECDLLPLVLEMRLRGIRVDLAAAERARDLLLRKRDAVFAELSANLECSVGMHEIGRSKWLTETFDRLGIEYLRTEKGNPSFAGGQTGWMSKHPHWLPQLITKGAKYNNAATKFLQNYILDHAVNGRIHAEIHPHRSEDSGTKSFRFSYSDPPLQQMTSRDEELAPLIRGVFLPEEGQVWAKPDASQQEFRLVVHYANQHKLHKAADAVARYRDDPDADFHALVAAMTGLERRSAKDVNFAKIYGAGVGKFADMIGTLPAEAQRIYAQYDRELPFLRELSDIYTKRARNQGYITLYDGARRHFDKFAPSGKWKKGSGPCGLEEAGERLRDPSHPWYQRGQLYRVDTHTALNALIQGSAARHTKLWMRACWHEGIVPLLQMHDCLDCSVSSLEQAKLVAELGCAAVQLDVPMRVDLKFGRTWGDAKHSWAELQQADGCAASPTVQRIVESNSVPDATDALSEPCAPAKSSRHEGHDLDHERRPAASDLPHGDGAHSPLHQANRARLSVAGGISGAPGAGANYPQNHELHVGASQRLRSTYWTFSYACHPHGDSGQKQGQLIDHWIYAHPVQPNYLRVDKHKLPNGERRFYQHHWNGTRWLYGIKGTYAERKILYRLPQLSAALVANPDTEVHIAEGEKDVGTLAQLGFIATTNPGGALSWTEDLTAWFRVLGVHRAVIHEDHDEAGERRTTALNKALSGFVELRIIHYPDVPAGEDVTWWIEHGHTREELTARIAAAPQLTTELGDWDAGDDVVPPSPRPWLLGGQFCRTFLSGLVAPGATGKTALRLLQAIALATGRPLTSQYVFRRCRVLVVSFEDDREELRRRLLAARLHHNVNADELKGWLFLASPKGLKLVEMRNGNRIVGALEPALRHAIERRRPDLVVLDPFVKLHGLEENDNSAMDHVADLLTQLAHEYDIAIDSPAHTRKGLTVAGDADARRGASAARDAGRLDYTLIPMSEEEAKVFGIAAEERRSYVRLDSAKVNLLPPARKADWFRLVSVDLRNATADYPDGDRVQTVEPWIPPDTWDGLDPEALDAVLSEINAGLPNGRRYSSDNAAKDRAAWRVVEKHCPTKTEAQCREVIRAWLKVGTLREIEYYDTLYRKLQKGLQVDGQKHPNRVRK